MNSLARNQTKTRCDDHKEHINLEHTHLKVVDVNQTESNTDSPKPVFYHYEQNSQRQLWQIHSRRLNLTKF